MIPESDLQRAREVDLLSFLRVSDPGQLVRFSRNTYCTREHDSLKISNGKWHWFSRGIGGVNALDYLMKVQGYSLPDAVNAVLGNNIYEKACKAANKEHLIKELKLPLFSDKLFTVRISNNSFVGGNTKKQIGGIDSPLFDCINDFKPFFDAFSDFQGYVEFFLLQDLVTEDYTGIKYWYPFPGEFYSNPLPKTPEEYLEYVDTVTCFLHKRNDRIKEWAMARTNL